MDIITALSGNLLAQAADPIVIIPSLLAGVLGRSKKIVLLLCLSIGGFFVTQSLLSPLPPHADRVLWAVPLGFVAPVAAGLAAFFCTTCLLHPNPGASRSLPLRAVTSFAAMLCGSIISGGLAFGAGLLFIEIADLHSNDGSAIYTLALVIVPLAALIGAIAGITVSWKRSRPVTQDIRDGEVYLDNA